MLTSKILDTIKIVTLQIICSVPFRATALSFSVSIFLILGITGILKRIAAANRNMLFINFVCIAISTKPLPFKPTRDLKKSPKTLRSSKWKIPKPMAITIKA